MNLVFLTFIYTIGFNSCVIHMLKDSYIKRIVLEQYICVHCIIVWCVNICDVHFSNFRNYYVMFMCMYIWHLHRLNNNSIEIITMWVKRQIRWNLNYIKQTFKKRANYVYWIWFIHAYHTLWYCVPCFEKKRHSFVVLHMSIYIGARRVVDNVFTGQHS